MDIDYINSHPPARLLKRANPVITLGVPIPDEEGEDLEKRKGSLVTTFDVPVPDSSPDKDGTKRSLRFKV